VAAQQPTQRRLEVLLAPSQVQEGDCAESLIGSLDIAEPAEWRVLYVFPRAKDHRSAYGSIVAVCVHANMCMYVCANIGSAVAVQLAAHLADDVTGLVEP
jgi:hypothetical protein